MTVYPHCDIAIVGGGLAGGLVAYALSVRRPELDVRVVESTARLGGNHVWSFFGSDIADADRWIVAPFVDHSWDGYDVRFPGHARTLDEAYNSIRSEHYDAKLRDLLPAPMRGEAVDIGATRVVLSDQSVLTAGGVIDARGGGDVNLLDVGWQKFVGHEVRTVAPHGLTRPIVMDATVPQLDGYRFVYVLPFGPDRLFIEDTYYSDGAAVDADRLDERIADYADANGWEIAEVLSSEHGALPVTMGGDFDAYWQSGGEAGKIGGRAGLFHPTTGYSLPDAVRTAALIVTLDDLSGPALARALERHAGDRWRERGFYRLLDRMLFRAAAPERRYRVLERFYRLSPALIGRFYAGQTTLLDQVRILAGKPPVPIMKALRVLREKNA